MEIWKTIKGLEVNHKDGNKLNNNDWNLEWSSSLENNLHAIKTKLRPSSKGKFRVGRPVINIDTQKFYQSIPECAKDFNLQPTTLQRYLTGLRKNKFPNLKLI